MSSSPLRGRASSRKVQEAFGFMHWRLGNTRTGFDWAPAIPGVRAHLTLWLFGRFAGRFYFGRTPPPRPRV